jgi:hypothetical protein
MLHVHFGGRERFPELERMICAVAGNDRLATQLLIDPHAALALLEQSNVRLSASERALVVSITGATDIYDFATRLYAKMHQPDEAAGQKEQPHAQHPATYAARSRISRTPRAE